MSKGSGHGQQAVPHLFSNNVARSYQNVLRNENEKENYFFPPADTAWGMYCSLCMKFQCNSRLYHLGLVIQIVYFSMLNANGETDSGTDGCSAAVLQHSRWEVSASQPHIHFALCSSCKSKLGISLRPPISLPLTRSFKVSFTFSQPQQNILQLRKLEELAFPTKLQCES